MDFLATVLSPLIWIFRHVLEAIHSLSGSYGWAIIGLSAVVAVAIYPLAVYGRNIELKNKAIVDAMAPQITEAKATLKGEARFHAIDAIYQEHGYHPIKSITSITGFALQIPFLLASLFLLIDYPPLRGQSFAFIEDLSKPDHLFDVVGWPLNILPILMSAITCIEAATKPELDAASSRRFMMIALGLLVLVYRLPSGVILYWTASNTWSLLRSVLAQYRQSKPHVSR